MAKVEPQQEWATAGATPKLSADVKGKIVEFSVWMFNNAYAESTIKSRAKIIRTLVKRGADLYDPESVKRVIATQKTWNDGTKRKAVNDYSSFAAMEGLTWEPPRYKPSQKLPFIPLESELDQIIAGSGKKSATFLQGLKETGADPGELWRVEWIDVDVEKRLVTINHPVKGHNPRILPISREWIGMLERLPNKEEERIFTGTLDSHSSNFREQRKRLALKLGNPRLRKVAFTTFRHWKATTEYHKTKDPYHVKKMLGHKKLTSTEIYINLESALFQTTNDDFTVRVAENIEEDKELIEAGFQYVTDRDCYKIYRKRK